MSNDQPHKKEPALCSCCKCKRKWYGLVLKWCLNIWILELQKTHRSQPMRSIVGTCTKPLTPQRRYTTIVPNNSPFINYHKRIGNRKIITWSNLLTFHRILLLSRYTHGAIQPKNFRNKRAKYLSRQQNMICSDRVRTWTSVASCKAKYKECRKLTSAYVYTSL